MIILAVKKTLENGKHPCRILLIYPKDSPGSFLQPAGISVKDSTSLGFTAAFVIIGARLYPRVVL